MSASIAQRAGGIHGVRGGRLQEARGQAVPAAQHPRDRRGQVLAAIQGARLCQAGVWTTAGREERALYDASACALVRSSSLRRRRAHPGGGGGRAHRGAWRRSSCHRSHAALPLPLLPTHAVWPRLARRLLPAGALPLCHHRGHAGECSFVCRARAARSRRRRERRAKTCILLPQPPRTTHPPHTPTTNRSSCTTR